MIGLSQLFSNIFNSKPKDSHVGLNDSIESANLTQLQVESDNFDVEVKQGDVSEVKYKLLINEGYSLSDMFFDINCNAPKVAFTIKTKKNNMSGTLKLLIPNSIIDINMRCLNGDISTLKILISSLNLITTNGDIKIIALDGDYKISCNSVNGDISNHKKSSLTASKEITCSSENGDITIL